MANYKETQPKPLNFASQEAVEKAKLKIAELEVKLAQARLDVGGAGDTSDWHDNFALDQAHQDVDRFNIELSSLREKTARVQIVKPRNETDTVGVGNKVELRFEGEQVNEEYTLLGKIDAMFFSDRISTDSPVGSAILGAKPGQVVTFNGGNQVKVVKISKGNF